MKKYIAALLGIIACFSACNKQEDNTFVPQTGIDYESKDSKESGESPTETISESTTESTAYTETVPNDSSDTVTERKLKLTAGGNEIGITLYDTPAANSLYNMLPLELSFEDFNGVEKISYLPEKLTTEGEPDGCDPDVGDLCLYAPWGNLSIFYKDFRYSNSLVLLGHIDSDMNIIGSMSEDFEARLEKAD